MNVFLRTAMTLIYLLAFVGTFQITSQALDRTPPLVYEEAIALEKTIPRNGNLNIQFTVFRERICKSSAKRWLTDSEGIRHSIPSFTVGLEFLAGRETYKRSITIPPNAALGPAYYQVIIEYSCNVFQQLGFPVVVESPPIRFEILESETLAIPQKEVYYD